MVGYLDDRVLMIFESNTSGLILSILSKTGSWVAWLSQKLLPCAAASSCSSSLLSAGLTCLGRPLDRRLCRGAGTGGVLPLVGVGKLVDAVLLIG